MASWRLLKASRRHLGASWTDLEGFESHFPDFLDFKASQGPGSSFPRGDPGGRRAEVKRRFGRKSKDSAWEWCKNDQSGISGVP